MNGLLKILVVKFILLYPCFIYSQPANIVEFSDYDFDYIHYPWIDSLDVYNQDFWLINEPIVLGGEAIFVYNNRQLTPFGFLVEKVDVNTGEQIWAYSEFTKEENSRKTINNFQLIDNLLELYIIEESQTFINPVYPGWEVGYLSKITIDIDSGNIVQIDKTDHLDTDNLLITKNKFFSYNTKIFGQNDFYNVIKSEHVILSNDTRQENFIKLTIGLNGHLISSDTTSLFFPRITGAIRKNEVIDKQGSFLTHFGRVYEEDNTDSISVLLYFDEDLNLIDSIDISEIHKKTERVNIGMIKGGYDRIIIWQQDELHIDSLFDHNYFLIDSSGIILDELSINCTFSTNEDKLIGIGRYKDEDDFFHSFICQSNNIGSLDTLLDIKLSSTDATLYPVYSLSSDENDLLVSYAHRQPSFPPEFGVPLVFPNPSSDVLNFKNHQKLKRIQLIDNSGSILINKVENLNQLDMSELYSGSYWVKLFYNSSITILPIIKI